MTFRICGNRVQKTDFDIMHFSPFSVYWHILFNLYRKVVVRNASREIVFYASRLFSFKYEICLNYNLTTSVSNTLINITHALDAMIISNWQPKVSKIRYNFKNLLNWLWINICSKAYNLHLAMLEDKCFVGISSNAPMSFVKGSRRNFILSLGI